MADSVALASGTSDGVSGHDTDWQQLNLNGAALNIRATVSSKTGISHKETR